jgi:hypothetical protein
MCQIDLLDVPEADWMCCTGQLNVPESAPGCAERAWLHALDRPQRAPRHRRPRTPAARARGASPCPPGAAPPTAPACPGAAGCTWRIPGSLSSTSRSPAQHIQHVPGASGCAWRIPGSLSSTIEEVCLSHPACLPVVSGASQEVCLAHPGGLPSTCSMSLVLLVVPGAFHEVC